MVHWNSRALTLIEIVTFSIAFSIVQIVAVEYWLIEIVTKIVTSRISPLGLRQLLQWFCPDYKEANRSQTAKKMRCDMYMTYAIGSWHLPPFNTFDSCLIANRPSFYIRGPCNRLAAGVGQHFMVDLELALFLLQVKYKWDEWTETNEVVGRDEVNDKNVIRNGADLRLLIKVDNLFWNTYENKTNWKMYGWMRWRWVDTKWQWCEKRYPSDGPRVRHGTSETL